MKAWATIIKTELEPSVDCESSAAHNGKKDFLNVCSGLAQDRRAWSASVRDVVKAIGDAGSTRPR